MAARKPWRDLTAAYRKRLSKHGLTEKNYNTPEGARLRQTARGHGKTPEHPERANKQPARYREYLNKGEDELRQVMARKERLFGDRIKYRPRSSENATHRNPQTKQRPRLDYMRRFLRMTPDQVNLIDWSDKEWGFLFYH